MCSCQEFCHQYKSSMLYMPLQPVSQNVNWSKVGSVFRRVAGHMCVLEQHCRIQYRTVQYSLSSLAKEILQDLL